VGAWNAVNALHDAYIREAPKHPSEAPVVVLHDIVERRYTSGTSFEPSFVITEWVPRPADLDDEAKVPFLDC